MNVNEYRVKLVHAPIINMESSYGGVSNPVIYDKFAVFLETKGVFRVWDAFANKFGESIWFFESRGINVVSHNIDPSHPDVLKKDSTMEGPPFPVDAVILHPPYFGASPFSQEDGELSLLKDEKAYFDGLSRTIRLTFDCLTARGYVCAIGRSYLVMGKPMRLGEWFVEEFSGCGFELVEVWKSTPDVAIVMRKT